MNPHLVSSATTENRVHVTYMPSAIVFGSPGANCLSSMTYWMNVVVEAFVPAMGYPIVMIGVSRRVVRHLSSNIVSSV